MLHCQIISQTHELFDRALNLYGEGRDKEWSLVDCASILLMWDHGISEALTNDRHFVQAEMIPLMRD